MVRTSKFRNPQLDGEPFYWKAGPAGVLLCHGFTATTAEVRLLANCLHADGYTIAAPLLPGHASSPQDCNRFTWQDWYASVEGAYLQLVNDCQRVVVGGESTGALLILHLAARHPECAGVLCYAPALRLKMGRMGGFLLSILAPFFTSVPKPASKDDNPWQGYSVQPLKAAVQLTHLQKATPAVLPEIRQPILIVQGRLDPTVHPESPQAIYQGVSSVVKELYWLEHSTHCVILDRERDLAAELTRKFLTRIIS